MVAALVLRVDDEVLSARAGDNAARRGAATVVIVTVVEMNAVLVKIDDQLDRAIRQQTLHLVSGRSPLRQPELIDKIRQRRARPVTQKLHSPILLRTVEIPRILLQF